MAAMRQVTSPEEQKNSAAWTGVHRTTWSPVPLLDPGRRPRDVTRCVKLTCERSRVGIDIRYVH
jgi:hypothetical protein